MYWDTVHSKGSYCIVSANDFANEAWLLMQKHNLEQLVVVNSQGVMGYITRQTLETIPEEIRVEKDVQDFVTPYPLAAELHISLEEAIRALCLRS